MQTQDLQPGKVELGLGCNSLGHIDQDAADRLVRCALDSGVRTFDTAPAYASGRSEAELGRMLPRERDGLRVITKAGHPNDSVEGHPCSPANIRRSVELSLRRLRCERLDCLVIHFPDPNTPFMETMSALQDLRRAGKVQDYALSNFTSSQMLDLLDAARQLGAPSPQFVQEEYNLLHREKATALLPALRELGISLMPFFPLASGLLTDSSRTSATLSPLRRQIVRAADDRFLNDATVERLEQVHRLCRTYNISVARLALHWLAAQQQVSIIIAGASRASQLAANIRCWREPVGQEALSAADGM